MGSSPRVPDSVDLRWGLRKCISNMLLLQSLKRGSSPLPRGLDHTLLPLVTWQSSQTSDGWVQVSLAMPAFLLGKRALEMRTPFDVLRP